MKLLSAAAAVALATSGCATHARVHRYEHGVYEGHVLGGTKGDVILELPDGRRLPIPRGDVTAIEHPGRPQIVAGGATFLLGGIGAMVVAPSSCSSYLPERKSLCAASFVPVALGAAVLTWGIANYLGSSAAAESTAGLHQR